MRNEPTLQESEMDRVMNRVRDAYINMEEAQQLLTEARMSENWEDFHELIVMIQWNMKILEN